MLDGLNARTESISISRGGLVAANGVVATSNRKPPTPKDSPLFRAAIARTGQLAASAIHVNDICRMMKRRLKDAALPARLSPHSFRVAVITDLLEQGVSLEEVQHLAGHADPRTTRLYDPGSARSRGILWNGSRSDLGRGIREQ